MRFALLGTHPDGLALARALCQTGRHQIAAVTSPPAEDMRSWLGRSRLVDDLADVIADPALEAVIVAGPVAGRDVQLRRALQSERHVLCVHPADEKPDLAYEAAMMRDDTGYVLFPLLPEGLPPATLLDRAESIPRGTPFILTFLEPTPGERLDTQDFDQALTALAGRTARRGQSRFQVWAGVAGESGGYHREADRPFRDDFPVLGDRFSVRMESWLPYETFRRAGFGHVLRGREPILTVERGVSLVWFARDGSPAFAYAGGLYAASPRVRIPVSVPQQVASGAGAILDMAPLPDGPTDHDP